MKIDRIDIHNFRKLRNCRVELSEKETVFVGANNSGKTSAMDALIYFLDKDNHKNISSTDFTLSNWYDIIKIGEDWVSITDEDTPNLNRSLWEPYVPGVDVWLYVGDKEIQYVRSIIPSLGWSGGLLGVRLIFEPKNIEALFKEYKSAYDSAKKAVDSRILQGTENKKPVFSLWPKSMKDFLDKKQILHKHFGFKAYILDPAKYEDIESQAILLDSQFLENDPLNGLIRIDTINAQRGFSDPNTRDGSVNSDRRLSGLLRQYYDKHLDPAKMPNNEDIDALEAIEDARTVFDTKLQQSFKSTIKELEELNYPGFSDPDIILSSKLNLQEGLNHESAVQFKVTLDGNPPGTESLCLPENYNGLGYQNLIYMVFRLIQFRDEWMRAGKDANTESEGVEFIEPLHLVLIEEPEAHLHAQVQQVFIKKAYNVLRNHTNLRENKKFNTQIVISTHSSHIAHQIDFTCLRYFRREQAISASDAPCVSVINLSETFGSDNETSKFATRYLKTTHCDLFFADATILIEGSAERMLIPYFICNQFSDLNRSYISLLEISGSHAHRLRPLIETLGLLSLVITDLDSVEIKKNEDGKKSYPKVRPERGKEYLTGNSTIKNWAPGKVLLDDVLCVTKESKEASDGLVRIAYQYPMKVTFKDDNEEEAIPYTFEDALVLRNLEFFKGIQKIGLIKRMVKAVNKPSLIDACMDMFMALKDGNKAEMALDILYITDPKNLHPPEYIEEGLEWLNERLKLKCSDFAECKSLNSCES